jgi:hypothetical protein
MDPARGDRFCAATSVIQSNAPQVPSIASLPTGGGEDEDEDEDDYDEDEDDEGDDH